MQHRKTDWKYFRPKCVFILYRSPVVFLPNEKYLLKTSPSVSFAGICIRKSVHKVAGMSNVVKVNLHGVSNITHMNAKRQH